MSIHKLPEYLINRLKAGEIVERPSSVLKELVENSLDAGANEIIININDGGKNLIGVEDNGTGIELGDMDMLFERYATSKINGEQDLYNLQSYGFRGEALASIAEVGKTTVISKTSYSEIGSKLTKTGQDIKINHLPVGFDHGTIIQIQDLFYNVPVRLKFLKSSQTEFFYCYNYFIDVALYHYDKHFVLKKNNKIAFDLPKADGILKRILQIYKKDWSKNLKEVSYQDEGISLNGFVGNNQILFGSGENIKIYVNSRPVQDKIIKKALMDAYFRQIMPGEYPFAILLIEAKAGIVDVNVHPKKSEVKFINPQKIFQIIYDSVQKALGNNKIGNVNFNQQFQNNYGYGNNGYNQNQQNGNQTNVKNLFGNGELNNIFATNENFNLNQENQENAIIGNYKVIGQLRDSYIILQGEDGIYYVDQHALAERILFEKIKKTYTNPNNNSTALNPEILLQPLIIQIPPIVNINEKINQINKLGFDCSMLAENKIMIYAVPQIFSIHQVDIEKLFNYILYLENISFQHILDQIFASKACKVSIKAGDKLSFNEMINLIKDGFENINGMFVCQHGRPSFIKMDKKDFDKMFDRN